MCTSAAEEKKERGKKVSQRNRVVLYGSRKPKFISNVNTLAFIILNEEHPLQPWSAVSLVSAEICH